MRLDGCIALITGASAGIGREFARQLNHRAKTLVLVARRQERLEQLRDELLRNEPNLVVHVRPTDLAQTSQVCALADWLEQENIGVNLLINNAGLGDLGSFATSDAERNERIVLVNMLAPTLLARRLLPRMIANGHGAIVNVSSSAGFLPIAGFAVYAASKAYLTSFSEGIRAELRENGITVCAVCPGPVHTEFTEVAYRQNQPERTSPEFMHVSAQKVARDSLAAVAADRPILIPGFAMKLAMFLVRITPMVILRFASRLSAR